MNRILKNVLTPCLALLSIVPVIAAEPASPRPQPRNKTLVAWAAPANLTQQGGSVLTIQSGDHFDAIVFGERSPGKWMAGSDFFRRTQPDQSANAKETAGPGGLVQMAIIYQGDGIRIYRNGEPYAAYKAENIDLLSANDHLAVFGLRHVGASSGTRFAGTIDDARIYSRALTLEEIRSLRPNEAGPIRPLAWWDFEGGVVNDRTGHFTHHGLSGGAKIEGGRLVLDGKGCLIAARTEAAAKMDPQSSTPLVTIGPFVPDRPHWPEQPPATWLTYHLAHPGPGTGMPGDPNCAFFWNGRYHLHYIYNNNGFCFAHVSSTDMVHWRWHPTTLVPRATGHGMFSGTGFITKEGRPAIIYHGAGSGRNQLAFALDDQLEHWTRPVAIMPKEASGADSTVRQWDPDCWLRDDTYYGISGGGPPHLMKSADLTSWQSLGLLMHDRMPTNLGVTREEDVSCANMFKIGNKWMLLCISHKLGCRYYLGDFKDEKYLPEFHAMMNWKDWHYFAPESLLTPDGRRVMWAWCLLKDLPIQSGIQSLPRELSLPEDGVLRIRPLRELESLRYDEKTAADATLPADGLQPLNAIAGDTLELQATFVAGKARGFGLNVYTDREGKAGFPISVEPTRGLLTLGAIEVPFTVKPGEDVTLRVFLDKNMIEVFANDRQAAVAPHRYAAGDQGVSLFSHGGAVTVKQIKCWKMKSIY